MVLLGVLWVILWFALPGRADRGLTAAMLVGAMGTFVVMFFLPESIYGTTMELLDAKVLRVVESLQVLLNNGSMDFTEAVYFRAKENLTAAREELPPAIYLTDSAMSRSCCPFFTSFANSL